MFKGLIILLVVGAAFLYAVLFLVNKSGVNVSSDAGTSGYAENIDWKKYYAKDVLGEPILVLKDVPLKKAKLIWRQSPLRKEMLSQFPDFEAIRSFAENRLSPSPFRDYLLKNIDKISGDFQAGLIDANQAKERLFAL